MPKIYGLKIAVFLLGEMENLSTSSPHYFYCFFFFFLKILSGSSSAPWVKLVLLIDSVLKRRDITLLTKFRIVKAMVFFPVVMYRCVSWTIKKSERQRIDAFKLWFWRRPLRVPWTARSNQSILKEVNREY